MQRTTRNSAYKSRLLMGSALAMIAVASAAGAAYAQNNKDTETVVVTGTSIRGAAPVGANIITMDSSAIEATGAMTTQDLLTNIPQLSGFGNQGAGTDARGGLGTADASGSSSPNIHSLGASSSSTTLILVDGHRVPLSGLTHTLVDPSIIAADAIARVDVLPDGTSAVYGSDASAGVVNIITKKKYNGLEFTGSYGDASGLTRTSAGLSFGKAWEDGAAMIAYDYQTNSHLLVRDRDYLANDLRSRGGFNGGTFNCEPADIIGATATTGNTNATGTVFVYPYTAASAANTTTVSGAQPTANCDNSKYQSILPAEVRHNAFVSFSQQFGDRVTVNVDLGFSNHIISNPVSRGTVSTIAYGPGSAANASLEPLSAAAVASYNAVAVANGQTQITATNVTQASSAALKTAVGLGQQVNPFYQSGTSGLTVSEGVRYNFDNLFGPGAYTKGGQLDVFVAGSVDVALFSDWIATLNVTAGLDNSTTKSRGTVNTNVAQLALNGTPLNGTTSPQVDQFGLGETIAISRIPLTTANALDVWSPAGTNQTSAAIRTQLLDNPAARLTQQEMNDVKLSFTGGLFALPAGDVKTAVGVEYMMNNFVTGALNDPLFGLVNANATAFKANRSEYAVFAEFRIPVIGPDMNIPLVQSFDLDVAGRHDHYSTFGDTDNPKVSFSWLVMDGIKFTGSYGTSFVAPALTALPAAFGATTVSGNSNGNNQGVLATHVNAPGSWCAAGCTLDAGHQGITIGGALNSNAETAMTHTFGIDLTPGRFIPALNGLRINVGYWENKSKGLITTPTLANEAQVPGLQPELQLAPPGGWTPTSPVVVAAIAGALQTGSLQTPIWFIYRNLQQNAFNILANGLDFDVSYTMPTDTAGNFTFDLSGSDKLRFDETAYGATATTRFLNGYNVNTTFSSLAFTGRFGINWSMDPFTASVAVNYVNPYMFQTTNPFTNTGLKFTVNDPVAGVLTFQHISASYPVDLHFGYTIPNDWSPYTTGMSLSLTINNILDQKPPFFNNALGYDPNNASPVGRLVQVSLRKKL